ncbi:hypothetical protein HYW46_06465 [Candidatus Daviesbacteria bacterium]|nr:hypothetical protein [Candidatus Daviesbacteria bacterium]
MNSLEKIVQKAKKVLASNRQKGVSKWGGREYDFVCPSAQNYPFQWFWDSAFHAIALLQVDPGLAKQEIICLLQAAQPDGFIPHMILWEKSLHKAAENNYSIILADEFYTATIQPPVLARAVFRIYQTTKDREFLLQVLPKTINFFNWLKEYRDPDNDSLISIIQPDESGLDACSKYDLLFNLSSKKKLNKAMRFLVKSYVPFRKDPKKLPALNIFNWEDVMVNSIYADGLECLEFLSKEAGFSGQAAELKIESQQTINSLMEKCWDKKRGVFWDLYGEDEKQAKILTFSSIFPLILKNLDNSIKDRLISEHLLDKKEFWLPYPIPSVAANEPSFVPDFTNKTIWRGPSWVNINWYIWQALKDDPRRQNIATELANRTLKMVEIGGMREFFNPYTAEGMGAINFGWTTLILDMIS